MTNPEFEAITLERSGKRPLRFVGRRIFEWASSPNNASSRYSGSPGRWREVAVYQERGGRYVVHSRHYSLWQGEPPALSHAIVLGGTGEVAAWLEANCPPAAQEFCQQFDIAEELGGEA